MLRSQTIKKPDHNSQVFIDKVMSIEGCEEETIDNVRIFGFNR